MSSALFASPPLAFDTLALAHADEQEISRIYSVLWEIAKLASPGSSLMARAKLATAFVRFAHAHVKENPRVRDFLENLQSEKIRWPTDLQALFDREIPELRESFTPPVETSLKEEAKREGSPDLATHQPPQKQQSLVGDTVCSENAGLGRLTIGMHPPLHQVALGATNPQTGCLELLDGLLINAKNDSLSLNRVREVVESLIREKDALSNHADAAHGKQESALSGFTDQGTEIRDRKICT